MTSQDLHDELIERAKYGEISGEAADVEAISRGMGSLSKVPPDGEFRPEKVPHWTLPMALAWIVYRDHEEVRRRSLPYSEACWDWNWKKWRLGFDGPVHEGWLLEQRPKPTAAMLTLSVVYDRTVKGNNDLMSVPEAEDALLDALRGGHIVASGIDVASSRRIEIAALEWHELVFVEARNQIDEARRGLLGPAYTDVLFPADILKQVWRPPRRSYLNLPALVAPQGHGFMPLYCAAQWIATAGGSDTSYPVNLPVWEKAYEAIVQAIASGLVQAVGMRDGRRGEIPAYEFVGIRVDYPFHEAGPDPALSGEVYLRSCPYIDDDHWRGGLDDALVLRFTNQWSQIVVFRLSVRTLWPFSIDEGCADQTGLPGRPGKSKQLIEQEFLRRTKEGVLKASLREESEALFMWFRDTHPSKPRPTATTIANNIRNAFNRERNRTK
jgi:hypothetical protein